MHIQHEIEIAMTKGGWVVQRQAFEDDEAEDQNQPHYHTFTTPEQVADYIRETLKRYESNPGGLKIPKNIGQSGASPGPPPLQ